MRIISGKLKGKYVAYPKNFHSRPTTDRAREALFSIIDSQFEFPGLHVLDLFFGTGSISLEFVSRGADRVVSVDSNFHSIKHLNKFIDAENLENIKTIKSDYKIFLQHNQEKYDIVFADPPFDMEGVTNLPDLIFSFDLFTEIGTLIVEHSDRVDFSSHPKFVDLRKYGGVNFSFFEV